MTQDDPCPPVAGRVPATPGATSNLPRRSSLAAAVRFGLAAGVTVFAGTASATPASLEKQTDTAADIQQDTDLGFRNGSFVVAPIPFSNPTIGSGLVLGAGYLFNMDPGSKPSVIGLAGMRSDNGSQAYGFSVNLYFDNNRWLFESLFARADVRYDLFTSLGPLPIRQDGVLGRVSLSYGVTPDLSFGGTLRYLNTNVDLDAPGLPPIPPPYNNFLSTELVNLGVVGKWDTRDDTLYPTRGFFLEAEAAHGTALDSSLPDYDKGFINYTHYVPTPGPGVVAARISTCAASSSAPFFDQCSLGVTDAFRGFSATQFLDLRSASVQVEYRRELNARFHGVVFGGTGVVGSSYSDIGAGGTHSAAGIGLRYRVSKKFPVDLSVDVARNDLKENLVYVYVGQRF